MVLLSDKSDAVASWSFEAEILVLHHPTTISVNYQAMGKSKLLLKVLLSRRSYRFVNLLSI